MPPISGPASLFSASAPSRRRTNPARLSSSSPRARGTKISIPMRSFPGHENQPRAQEWKHHGRGHQHHALRHRVQPPAAPYINRRALAAVRANQLVLQPQPLAQLGPRRLLGDERIGPALDGESVLARRRDLAAPARRALDQRVVAQAALLQVERSGQPADATANDHRPRHRAIPHRIKVPSAIVPQLQLGGLASSLGACKYYQSNWGAGALGWPVLHRTCRSSGSMTNRLSRQWVQAGNGDESYKTNTFVGFCWMKHFRQV